MLTPGDLDLPRLRPAPHAVVLLARRKSQSEASQELKSLLTGVTGDGRFERSLNYPHKMDMLSFPYSIYLLST